MSGWRACIAGWPPRHLQTGGRDPDTRGVLLLQAPSNGDSRRGRAAAVSGVATPPRRRHSTAAPPACPHPCLHRPVPPVAFVPAPPFRTMPLRAAHMEDPRGVVAAVRLHPPHDPPHGISRTCMPWQLVATTALFHAALSRAAQHAAAEPCGPGTRTRGRQCPAAPRLSNMPGMVATRAYPRA